MGKTRKVALILGINGMDGSHLSELLLSKGYIVHGMIRRASTYNRDRIEGLNVKLHYGDVTDPFSIMWALKASKPDEIYSLAAQSHVGISWELPHYTAQVTGIGVLNLLEAVRVLGLKSKIYQASTSELFDGLNPPYNEESVMNPVSPYGTAKMFAFQICKNYRDAYKMFICNGILFNHESPRRGKNFVTQKIVESADSGVVYLGNTDAERDWGYSVEYVEGMWRMLQQKKPDDYVLATGEMTSVKQFVGYVEQACGHKIKIVHDKGYDRPTDVPHLQGDASKAKKKLGWKPKVKAEELAEIMYNSTKI